MNTIRCWQNIKYTGFKISRSPKIPTTTTMSPGYHSSTPFANMADGIEYKEGGNTHE